MYQKSLESLIKTANQAGAIVICEYRWPASWPSCWELQRLIFEAQTHMGGVQIAFLMHFWNNHVIINPKERYKQCRKKATQLLP